MKNLIFIFGLVLFFSCKSFQAAKVQTNSIQIEIEPVLVDSISVRAITFTKTHLFYAGNKGKYGYINLKNLPSLKLRQVGPKEKTQYRIKYDSVYPGFRSIATTQNAQFLLSVANPALLYKTDISGKHELVYTEKDSAVFYDSMAFWNEKEGLAFGDPTDGCMSIIITRDGGESWEKVPCEKLPIAEDEHAFAASNSNIAIMGNNAWLITGGKKSRVYFSGDKGKSWTVFNTPLIQGSSTTGGYSIDFYDEKIGVVIGGDYTKPEQNQKNKAMTFDGGKTWELIAMRKHPGYKSCIQFVPNSNGKKLVAVGPSGISYSENAGKNWEEISKEGFYTIRFLNDSTAYVGGKNRICKLVFR